MIGTLVADVIARHRCSRGNENDRCCNKLTGARRDLFDLFYASRTSRPPQRTAPTANGLQVTSSNPTSLRCFHTWQQRRARGQVAPGNTLTHAPSLGSPPPLPPPPPHRIVFITVLINCVISRPPPPTPPLHVCVHACACVSVLLWCACG